MDAVSTIATVALETGISKEVLRKWEDRYGFPIPQRDTSGRRLYAAQQTVRLKLIKRLIDAGMRPSHVVSLDQATLQSLLLSADSKTPASIVDSQIAVEIIHVLRSRDHAALSDMLKREIAQRGLESFVLEVMSTLTVLVGDAWATGEIGIRDEHIYSEMIQGLIRQEILHIAKPNGVPRMLITTLTGELHTLGILMIEALASLHGACCISLGAQTPVEEIPLALRDFHADIICLSFSTAFPKRRILPLLKELREIVPKQAEIWVGGAGTIGLGRAPRGIKLLLTLPDVIDSLHKFIRTSGM